MKQLSGILLLALLLACNNSKNDKSATENPTQSDQNRTTAENSNPPPASYSSGNNFTISIGGNETGYNGSILVDKDEKKLQAGAPYRGMITTSSGPDNSGMILRFVFDTKPGSYPVTGMSYNRGTGDAAEQYGGLLGGAEKIYDTKVTLTECKDMGENGTGGHKWSISGTVESLTIPAMGLMLMDESKKHPREIKLDKISFTGLGFDDNWEEMMEKAMDMMKKKE
ncbi:MAG: hypothetical protein HZB42_09870 [Sphingobacteriales bacterium]|nr:hypothetical protein [Sphingobacteriales bacterium]